MPNPQSTKQSLLNQLYSEGRFNGGFFALRLGGLIFGGAHFLEFYGMVDSVQRGR